MMHWDGESDSFFQAQLEGSKQPAHGSYSHLGASIGLRVVWLTVLSTDALKFFHLASQHFQRLVDQRHQCPLIVSFQDELDVPKPSDVGAH